MKRVFTLICGVFLVAAFSAALLAQEGAKPENKEKKDDEGKWANTVWKKVNNLTKEKRSFQVEKATTVAGVRGSEAEDRLMKQLYYRGGGKYPSRLELMNAIEILESSIKAAPNDPSVPESMYFIGQCHEQLGNSGDAIDAYEDIIKDFPETDFAKEAQQALRRLK